MKNEYRHRGLMVDVARHFFDANEIKKIIEELAKNGLNRFHWHLSDDQGFRLELKKFPKLTSLNQHECYTQQEVQEVVQFALERGVEIIPEIDLPGHTTAILAGYPEYSCAAQEVQLAVKGGIYPVTLCPSKETTFDFLRELLAEVTGLFPGQYFHIGGDEAPDIEWKKCPHCQAFASQNHYQSSRQLQGYFANRVKDLLKSFGKSIICWNDMLESDNFEPDEDTIIQFWSVQYADSMQRYIEKGGKFIYSDMFELYFDYNSAMTPLSKVYHTVPQIRTVDYSGYKNLVGVEAAVWTESITSNQALEARIFPRIYAMPQTRQKSADYASFKEEVEKKSEAARERGIQVQSLAEADPQGEARTTGIRDYLRTMQSMIAEEVKAITMEHAAPNEEFNQRFHQQFLQIEAGEKSED